MNREGERDRDADLVWSGLRGDRQALQELVDYYQVPIFNVVLRILGDAEAAADATQTTFLLAFEKLQSFDPEFKFFSWIYRIAINEALDHRKKRQQLNELAHADESGSAGFEAEDKMYKVEIKKVIQEMLMGLQADYRMVIILRHLSELSYDEIANILDIPVKTVRSRLYSARKILKSHLRSEGYE